MSMTELPEPSSSQVAQAKQIHDLSHREHEGISLYQYQAD